MNLRQVTLLIVAVVVALAIGEGLWRAVFPRTADPDAGGLDKSFMGVGGFVELVRTSGLTVEVNRSPYSRLAENIQSPLWVIMPTNVGARDAEALLRWVNAGNTLVLVPQARTIGAEADPFLEVLGIDNESAGREIEPAAVADGDIELRPLGREPHYSLSLAVREIQDGWTASLSLGAHPLVWERDVGAGRLVFLNSSNLMPNLFLRMGDNATLAYDIARYIQADHRELNLDRYGNVPHSSGSLIGVLTSFPFARVTTFVALLALLVIWSQWSPGPPTREPPAARRREKSEYVAALALLMDTPEHHVPALEAYRSHLLTTLRVRHGTSEPADLAQIAADLYGLDAEEAARLLEPVLPVRLSAEALLTRFHQLEQLAERTQHAGR